MKNIPFADLGTVARLELRERPVGDVLPPVGAVFGKGVEGEALCIACKMQIWNTVHCQAMK
jgi:hypothetical protein